MRKSLSVINAGLVAAFFTYPFEIIKINLVGDVERKNYISLKDCFYKTFYNKNQKLFYNGLKMHILREVLFLGSEAIVLEKGKYLIASKY